MFETLLRWKGLKVGVTIPNNIIESDRLPHLQTETRFRVFLPLFQVGFKNLIEQLHSVSGSLPHANFAPVFVFVSMLFYLLFSYQHSLFLVRELITVSIVFIIYYLLFQVRSTYEQTHKTAQRNALQMWYF